MSFIIGKKCEGVCDTACVEVCPVDCINGPISVTGRGEEVENMTEEEKKGLQLYIDPTECINCGACLYECPVEAIYEDEEIAIAEGELDAVKKNYKFYGQEFKDIG
jgi:NAD-dependent dihydropyrimidine dehydrogenase PreA subunit|tara:strand:- start:205 stop:522 length:318 start_codon:yes stop_codon:yes gene_type:complete